MVILLKTALVRVNSIQIMQVRVQNKGKSVWKSRYDGAVSVPQRSKDPDPRFVSRTMNYQEKLKCGLVNGRQKILWIEWELRKNLTHIFVTLIL